MVEFKEPAKRRSVPAITMEEICEVLELKKSKIKTFLEHMTPLLYYVDEDAEPWIFGIVVENGRPAAARMLTDEGFLKDPLHTGQWRFIITEEEM